MVAAWSPAAVCIAVAALAGAVAAGWWAFEQQRAAAEGSTAGSGHPEGAPRPPRRPMLEPWVAVVIALAVAGLILFPRLIGVGFLFLPFLFGRRRRGPRRDGHRGPGDPRSGHDEPGPRLD